MDKFTQEHRKWLEDHLRRRSGERKRRLEAGHAHGEAEMLKRVWFPAFGQFRFLHPEYEVRDFLEGRRFLDFAYIRPPVRIAIEVDGYGTLSGTTICWNGRKYGSNCFINLWVDCSGQAGNPVGGGPARAHAWRLDDNHPNFPRLL